MTTRRPFDLDDLGAASHDDLTAATAMARRLADSIDEVSVATSAGFADRVMAAIADEPAPSTVGFLAPLWRRGMLGGFAASVRQAWVSLSGAGRPAFVRATALAYVLVVAIAGSALVGAATFGVAGALGMLGPTPTESLTPTPVAPDVTPAPTTGPIETPSPPAPVPSPSESADPSDDHGGGSGPEPSDDDEGGSGPEPSDDEGGDSGPGGGQDDSGSDDSSGSGSSNPEPTDKPRPTETPEPTETPH